MNGPVEGKDPMKNKHTCQDTWINSDLTELYSTLWVLGFGGVGQGMAQALLVPGNNSTDFCLFGIAVFSG